MAELRRRVDLLEQRRGPGTILVGLVDRVAGVVHLGKGRTVGLAQWAADCQGARRVIHVGPKVGEDGEPIPES